MHIYFMVTKDEVFIKFKEFNTASPHQLMVHTLQLDNSGEYMSCEFQSYLEQHGIVHQLVLPHTPEYNGVAKRFNSTIINMAQSMLANANILCVLWSEAVVTALHVNN
jgi:transposase InsO family protein